MAANHTSQDLCYWHDNSYNWTTPKILTEPYLFKMALDVMGRGIKEQSLAVCGQPSAVEHQK